MSKVGVATATLTLEAIVRPDLDTLLIAVYCAACGVFPADSTPKMGRPQRITDNELICLMVAQMLLGQPSDRRFLAVAGWRLSHLFPYLPSQSRYNERCRSLAAKLVVLWRAIAADLPGFHDQLSLIDTTPLPCGQSVQTTHTSELAPWCGYGYSPAHSRRYWGMRLVLWCGTDGCVRDFDLVSANTPEREAMLPLLAPSLAATTRTTRSVTFAPRARIALKAAWPGVSRKVICWSSCLRSGWGKEMVYAPMCWVIPPDSPAASPHASSPSAPPSTSTGKPANQPAPSPPTGTNRSTSLPHR